MSALSELCRVLELGGTTRSATIDADAHAKLRAAGLIRAAGAAETVVCSECDEPHISAVERKDDRFRAYCPEAGWVAIEPDEIELSRCESGSLLARVATAFCVSRKKPIGLAGDRALWLGVFKRPVFGEDRRIDLCMAIGQPSETMIEALLGPGRPPLSTHSRLILTTSDWEESRQRAQRAHIVVSISDLISLSEHGSFEVDTEALDDHLAVALKDQKPKRVGRHPTFPQLIPSVVEEALARGLAPDLQQLRAPQVRRIWNDVYPGLEPPKDSRLRELLRDHRAANSGKL